MMELFTLGADRGAYTETRRPRAGARVDRLAQQSREGRRPDELPLRPEVPRQGTKTIFGKCGDFDWQDACRLCRDHPHHASFFVTKFWSYFVPTPPPVATQRALEALYKRRLRSAARRRGDPSASRALQRPAHGEAAGRATRPECCACSGAVYHTTQWFKLAPTRGQRLFYPPNVAGWDETALARHRHLPRTLVPRSARDGRRRLGQRRRLRRPSSTAL